MRRLQERRELELQRETEFSSIKSSATDEMKSRVRAAVVHSDQKWLRRRAELLRLDEVAEADARQAPENISEQNQWLCHRKRHEIGAKESNARRALRDIEGNVARRPLLMEQRNTQLRARERALRMFNNALKEQGVKDAISFFQDDELDVLAKSHNGSLDDDN